MANRTKPLLNKAENKLAAREKADQILLPARRSVPLTVKLFSALGVLVLLTAGILVALRFSYKNKIFPGAYGAEIYLGGLTRAQALDLVNNRSASFASQPLVIQSGQESWKTNSAALGAAYDNAGLVDELYQNGRRGSPPGQVVEQIKLLIGVVTNKTKADKTTYRLSLNQDKLDQFLLSINEGVVSPVQNSTITATGNQLSIGTDSQAGIRLDMFELINQIRDHFGLFDAAPVTAPTFAIAPELQHDSLVTIEPALKTYLSSDLTLNYKDRSWLVPTSQIVNWLQINNSQAVGAPLLDPLTSFYTKPNQLNADFSETAVDNYVQQLATSIDAPPQNAQLSFSASSLIILKPSQLGVSVDVAKSRVAVIEALKVAGGQRSVPLVVSSTQADVREDNLASLGIKELISEGVTYFPGSPSTRIINIRAGATKFNGVLVKPGDVFSFGAILGDVGPATGYVPELVILGDHEEKQYGGGLCQVSSTTYRAALLAGLPILERTNHAFAVSYYTAPFGIPGVDATIYYPAVDLKFRNDTGSYILIQTVLEGTTLKFDFYGTKTKSGVIRGPSFISGSSDATQPSQTVFYRDVLDLSGNVIKTDAVVTYYKSSKDFPINKQFN